MKTTKLYHYMSAIMLATIIILGVIMVNIKAQLNHTDKMIEHLDEEVDEAKTGVERLLKRDLSGETGSFSLAKVETVSTEYDFGRISKKNGTVSAEFILKNIGSEKLVIGEITTSCGCTSATINKKNILPGEDTMLTVKFNPNFHEEPEGRFSRSIFVPTNDPDNKEIEFKIFVEIKN